MSTSSSRLAYPDCEKLFSAALEDPKGVRLQVGDGDLGATTYFIMRMHTFRSIVREDNRTIYTDPAHPLYGRSEFDALTVQKKLDTEGQYWVYVSRNEIDLSEIESLSEEARE